ncbi:MAG: molybdenum cofactor biosynthesis protein MoaE [Candidatus Nezhaarchaeota archaeon]|nr:molybdenum cofactor biosynthesis protein MoaE [Candidatus Nezhaarchaeota archaeon]
MSGVGLVKKGEVRAQDLIEALRPLARYGDCGAIVVFNGVVRSAGRDGSRVLKLAYEAYEEGAIEALGKIRERVVRSVPGVREVLIYHVVDEVEPGEDTVLIAVAASHRHEAFKAAEEVLEAVKREAAIWKKEVTERGGAWVSS